MVGTMNNIIITQVIQPTLRKQFIDTLFEVNKENNMMYFFNTPVTIPVNQNIYEQLDLMVNINFMERPVNLHVQYYFRDERFHLTLQTSYGGRHNMEQILNSKIAKILES